jgi:hypothetical protein
LQTGLGRCRGGFLLAASSFSFSCVCVCVFDGWICFVEVEVEIKSAKEV